MITLPTPPRHITLTARLYLLLGGFPGVYAAFTLLATALLGSFVVLNVNPNDLFFSVKQIPAPAAGTVLEVGQAKAVINGRKVHVVSFVRNDELGSLRPSVCFALDPPKVGDVLPLETCRGAVRLQGTTFGEFGSLGFGFFMFFVSAGTIFVLSAFCALAFRLASGIRTIRLLRNAPLIYAHEFLRKETGVRVNEFTEECFHFRLTFPPSEARTDSGMNAELQPETEVVLKTFLGASLSSTEPQAILIESPKNVQLLANLLETLQLTDDGRFTLNGASLLSVLMVFVFLGFALAFPAVVLFILR